MTEPNVTVEWARRYPDRTGTAAMAMRIIKPGDNIFIGTGCGQPQHLVQAMTDRARELYDVHVIHLLTMGAAPYAGEPYREHFTTNTFFVAQNVRGAVHRGLGDYTPMFLSDIPQAFEEGRLPIDVALVSVSPPDARGQCSLGISVDIVRAAAASAKYVVAQVNACMPRTLGSSFLHVSQIDMLVPFDQPLIEVPAPTLDQRLRRIGQNVARLVEDGSTIECGIGRVPQAVAGFLHDKHDLGVHTEMFSDWIIDLIERGAINGSRKRINRGKIVASFCMGSRRLYDYVDNNPVFEFHPSEYVNDPQVIAQHERMVAINGALEIDLTGQVCADSLGHAFHSGFGGQVDFIRGASRSRGGKAIIALPSTARHDSVSRIVPCLSPGAGVVTTRADVQYVVTEYGTAYQHGKSIRQRALALIDIAHPQFRGQLIQAAKRLRYIDADQIELAWEKVRYPEELERRKALRDGSEVFLRPVKPSDEPGLSHMLYSLSAQAVRTRFFTQARAFPHHRVQQVANIDYANNLAIVALVPGAFEDQIVGLAEYALDPGGSESAEVAFIVHDDWQQKGMGSLLLDCLIDIAASRGVRHFSARVLPENAAMLAVFENCGYPVRRQYEGGDYGVGISIERPVETARPEGAPGA